jgi:hypothetical protein
MTQDEPALIIYLFRDKVSSADTMVCVGDKARIEAALGPEKVPMLFQGEVTYINDATERVYLGVWGARNSSRLRRVLREHDIELVIERGRPPNVRLRALSRIHQPKGM